MVLNNIMKYEVILFDADETLFDFKKSEMEAIKNTFIDFGFDYDENYHLKIYRDINSAIWKEFEEGLITQENLKTERFNRLAKKLQVNINVTDFGKRYMEHLGNGSFLLDQAEDLIESLNNKYTLAIITNGLTNVQKNRIGQSIIAKYFKEIIISEELGIAKPNKEIFDYTLDKLGHSNKSTVLMIGDSLTSDIQGGLNSEIHTCWYNPNELQNTSNFVPTYEAKSFSTLKDLLL